MKKRQPLNDRPRLPYFNGWFIALQNYEENEIEAIREKIALPFLEELGAYHPFEALSPKSAN